MNTVQTTPDSATIRDPWATATRALATENAVEVTHTHTFDVRGASATIEHLYLDGADMGIDVTIHLPGADPIIVDLANALALADALTRAHDTVHGTRARILRRFADVDEHLATLDD